MILIFGSPVHLKTLLNYLKDNILLNKGHGGIDNDLLHEIEVTIN